MFRVGRALLACAALLAAGAPVLAEDPAPESQVRQPLFFKSIEAAQTERELMIDITNALQDDDPAGTWLDPAKKEATNNVIDDVLRIAEVTNTFNGRSVTLRNYSIPSLGKGWVTGPTLRYPASDKPRTLRLQMKNDLPCLTPPCKCVSRCEEIAGSHDHHLLGSAPDPKVFNTTNLHTHGLFVSPKCPQDNVFLSLPGGCSFPVKVDIPARHHPGTFWYHAHLHGSTALQLASGMAGLLIIEGQMDAYLKDKKVNERLFVFQNISYDENGRLDDFSDIGLQDGDIAETSINGAMNPEIKLAAGQIERWRLLDGRISDTLPLRLVDKDKKSYPFFLIAVDGITIGPKPQRLEVLNLAPGYRADVLVQINQPGTYYLIKTSSMFEGKIRPADSLATIKVGAGNGTPENPADFNLPLEGIPAPIPDEGLIKRDPITFSIVNGKFLIDGREFTNPPPVYYTPKLGTAEEWTIRNTSEMDHPFHIHINPFQVTAISLDGKTEIQLKPEERVWRDTFLIPPKGGYFKMRTRFEKFDGRFVFHCHFLDHEDLGMMATVEIKP